MIYAGGVKDKKQQKWKKAQKMLKTKKTPPKRCLFSQAGYPSAQRATASSPSLSTCSNSNNHLLDQYQGKNAKKSKQKAQKVLKRARIAKITH